jgi:uncharacterized integral membrane protein
MSGRIITLSVLTCLIIYVLYNTQPVGVKFLFWETELSKALITLGSFLAGIILGFIIATINQFNKQKKRKTRQKRQKKERR